MAVPGSTFFSFPNAKNAMKRLSGDQNGVYAPSVPGNGRSAGVSKSRTQSDCTPLAVATKATWRPSGETAGG